MYLICLYRRTLFDLNSRRFNWPVRFGRIMSEMMLGFEKNNKFGEKNKTSK